MFMRLLSFAIISLLSIGIAYAEKPNDGKSDKSGTATSGLASGSETSQKAEPAIVEITVSGEVTSMEIKQKDGKSYTRYYLIADTTGKKVPLKKTYNMGEQAINMADYVNQTIIITGTGVYKKNRENGLRKIVTITSIQ